MGAAVHNLLLFKTPFRMQGPVRSDLVEEGQGVMLYAELVLNRMIELVRGVQQDCIVDLGHTLPILVYPHQV